MTMNNKKTAVLALNPRSIKLAQRIKSFMGAGSSLFNAPEEPLATWLPARWTLFENWVFVMPMGIVIRTIAPLIKNKHSDPAVVTVDEGGRYFISTLSGHEGGANRLARTLATGLGGEAIITTATEARKDLIVGVGCRRGTDATKIMAGIRRALESLSAGESQLRALASIDLKKDEKGLLEAARGLDVAVRFIPLNWIKDIPLDYTHSSLVEEKLGIGGVAEPCALLGGKRTKLILSKMTLPNLTIAVAREQFPW